jgi:pyruvate,orthophosphate dikinase
MTPHDHVIALDGTWVPGRELIGGKAWSIAQMMSGGLDVPPAFVLAAPLCAQVAARGAAALEEVWPQVRIGISQLEAITGRSFGGDERPLLVSVRSGAARSMPGMMDTVLNLGTTQATTAALARQAGAEFAADTAQRFTELWERIVGGCAPTDAWEQLRLAILAVFASWDSPRAGAYRTHHGIPHDAGTAVTVQAMVFGNLDERSGTGVLFTRNPLSGADEPYGEWLAGGQGEDVVSGRFTPSPLAALYDTMPGVHDQLLRTAAAWEREQGDVQDIEFTVESGRLWVLQSRAAKRSPHAGVRLATSLVDAGIITRDQALMLLTAEQVQQALQPDICAEYRRTARLLATGEPACPGVARGIAVSDPDEAQARSDAGDDVILVRAQTSPDDVHGMIAAVAVVTETGGVTSHAAVVCRELGRPAVVGAGGGVLALLEGREITVDGRTGEVFAGLLPVVALALDSDPDLCRLAAWAAESGAPDDLLAALRQA